jgi:hypothetical protein
MGAGDDHELMLELVVVAMRVLMAVQLMLELVQAAMRVLMTAQTTLELRVLMVASSAEHAV